MDSVKAKKNLVMLTAILLASLVLPIFAGAESLDDLNRQESNLNSQAKTLVNQIDSAAAEADKTLADVESLQKSVADNQDKLTATQTEIQETQANIEKRKAAVAERMKDIQVNNTTERGWQVVLDADSLSDLVNRVYAMNVLQSAEKEKVDDLNAEKAKLEELQQQLADTQKSLETDQATLVEKAQSYVQQVSSLKQQLADNQDALSGVLVSKQNEQERLAAEKARKEAEAKAQAKAQAQAIADAQAKAAAQAQAQQTLVAQPADNTNSSSEGSGSGSSNSNQSQDSSIITGASEQAAKEWIAMRESGGSYTATNSPYYGRYQLNISYLNGDLSPANQERVADSYVAGRYGSWVAAKAFWEQNNWY